MPFFVAALLIPFPFHNIIALLLFIAASITDMLDGKIARKYNLVTDFGKFADPLADKIRANVYGGAELSKAWKGVHAALYVLAAAGLVWCMLRLSSGAYNPFIYFRF